MLALWTAAAADGRMPTDDIVDPIKLGDLMGWLFVYQVERDPMRFRYLVHAPKITRRTGRNLTGLYVHDHPSAEAREEITGLLTAVVVTGRPHRGVSTRRLLDRDVVTEAVVLPLAGPRGDIDRLLALQIYDTPESAPEVRPSTTQIATTWIATSTRTPIEDGSQIRDVRVRLVYTQWAEAARHGPLPTKEIVNPARFGDLMGWLFLYRVERDPLQFFYVLYGSKISRRTGINLSNHYVDEYPHPETREAIITLLTLVADTGRPHHVLSQRLVLDHEVMTEAVVMPLAGPEGAIDHLLAVQVLDVPLGTEAGGAGRSSGDGA